MKLISFQGEKQRRLLRTTIKTETRLYAALKSLFDLLENYGPIWYTKHHHDKAKIALLMHERSLVMQQRTLKEGHRDFRKAA